MVNYDCIIILKVLLKKWYIVLGTVFIFGIVSFPLAKTSYQKAIENYHQFVPEDKELLFNVSFSYYVPEELEKSMDIYLACLNDKVLMQKVCDVYEEEMQWNSITQVLRYNYYDEENVFEVKLNNVSESEACFGINAVTVYLVGYLEENGFCKIEFKEKEIVKNECLQDINLQILSKPEKMKTMSRIILTAMLFGFVVGCMLVLLRDYYIKSSKTTIK